MAEWHAEPEQVRHDLHRRERLREAGWHVIVVTKKWLREDPDGVVRAVRAALSEVNAAYRSGII
jgi:very-short-patch-repair endonuclease